MVELDTIKASDAFGPGSSPGGHTKQSPIAGFFSCSFPPYPAAARAAELHPAAALHKLVDKRQIAAYNLVRLRDGVKRKRPENTPAPL